MNTLQNNRPLSENALTGKEIAFKRLAYIRKLLPQERPAKCMISVVPGREKVEIYYSQAKGVASIKNVFECNNIWACPVCARRVAFERRAELIQRLKGWKGEIFQYHLTMRHNNQEKLAVLYALQSKAHDLFKSGRWYQDLKTDFQILGNVVSREVTWASVNGWHPHMHTLAITTCSSLDREELTERITKRWQYCLEKVGASGLLNQSCWVTFRDIEEEKSIDYPIKWGIEEEITLGAAKKGRNGHENPFQLLERGFLLKYIDVLQDNEAAQAQSKVLIALFMEFLSVYSGSRQLRYDKGLKAAFGLSEEEISNQNTFFDDFSLLMAITRRDYVKIIKRGMLLELQMAYSTGDIGKIKEVLQKCGIDVE